jgi:hypothetical protein
MVLGSPRSKLGPKTKITWIRDPICCLMCIDLSYAFHIDIFLQCRTLHCKTRRASINMPKAIGPNIISLIIMPPWKSIGNILCATHGDLGMCKLLTLLWWWARMAAQGWEKLMWLGLCDLSSTLGENLTLHLVEPNTSSPSRWGVRVVNKDLEA